MANVHTYDPKKVKIAIGSHIATGFADDSFVTIEASGDGVTKKVGCDGEVVRSISPDRSYSIKVVLLQNSVTNAYLSNLQDKDMEDGEGIVPFIVKDLMGNEQFTTVEACVVKKASWARGKEAGTREWQLDCGSGKFTE